MTSAPITILATANTSWYLYNFRLKLLHRLRELGWNVVVAAPSDEYSSRLASEGFAVREVRIDSKGTNPLRDLATLRTYVSLMRAEAATAVLSFTVKPVVYGALAARLLRIPFVGTVTGLGSAFIRADSVTYVVKRLYKAALSKAAHVFFQNPDDLDLFRSQALLREGQKVSLVGGSGVDPAHFAPRPYGTGEKFTFLLATRMLRDKGVYEYVEAAKLVRGRFPATRFLLLGKADVDNPSAISRAQLEEWTRAGNVEYLGETDDVRPFIAMADVVVLPSYREGLPRVLLEAASMMRPIVTSDTTGCREVVVHGTTGLLCRPRDAADLAAALQAMLGLTDADRQRMGALGRQRVIERFTEDSVIAAYVEALRTACAARLARS